MLPLPYQSLLLFQLHYSIYKLISLSYSSSYLNPFCLSVSCPDHHFLFSIQFFYQSPIPPVYFLYLQNFQQLSPVHSIKCLFHIYKAHIYCFSSFNIPFTYCLYYTNCISCSSSSPKSIFFICYNFSIFIFDLTLSSYFTFLVPCCLFHSFIH